MPNLDDYEYIVETDYKSNSKYVILRWKTEPPTVEGWYWAADGDGKSPRIAEVFYSSGHRLYADFTDENIPAPLDQFPEITHWLGPLPVPAPPEAE